MDNIEIANIVINCFTFFMIAMLITTIFLIIPVIKEIIEYRKEELANREEERLYLLEDGKSFVKLLERGYFARLTVTYDGNAFDEKKYRESIERVSSEETSRKTMSFVIHNSDNII